MTRISKRTREQAADLCQLAASNGVTPRWLYIHTSCSMAERWVAESAIAHAMGTRSWAEGCAEAESLLRDGWTP